LDKSIIRLPNLEPGEHLNISIGKTKRGKFPQFTATGNEMKSLDIIANFSSPEAFTFIKLKDERGYIDNIVEFSTATLTATEKVKFSQGYKQLEDKDLIKRIRKGKPSIYMFNPDFILPKDYLEAITKWETL